MTNRYSDFGAVCVIAHGTGWLVADKPSGMSVHNDPEGDLCTLLMRNLRTNTHLAAAVGFDNRYGLHPVHRLDRDTSGVIVLGCQRDVFDKLSHQMRTGAVTKAYRALVHGSVQPAGDWRCWKWALTASSAGRRNPAGRGRRKPCKTQYRLMRQTPHYSLLECRLLTGRTHQIRRHAALAGHPLVGDKRYGSLRACRYLEKHHRFTRLGLHAAALTIRMPGEQKTRTFESDELPMELVHLMEADRE